MLRLRISYYFGWLTILLHFDGNNSALQNMRPCNNHQHATISDPHELYPNYKDKGTAELIEMFGYPVERHETMTEDGYFLTLFRIPYSNVSGPSRSKTPVLCMHGMWSSSDQWFWQPPHRALVDAGYDVWLGNFRGTSYSQKHFHLPVDDPGDRRYWDFSQTEYSKYDVPAFVDLITSATRQPSLYYIGHSLGAGSLLGSFAFNPQLNSKIRTIFTLAPAVFTDHSNNLYWRLPAHIFAQADLVEAATVLGFGRLVPTNVQPILNVVGSFCRIPFFYHGLCENFLQLVLGVSCQISPDTLPGTIAHFPNAVSVKGMSHAMQITLTGAFKQYDYGIRANQKVYGRPIPPDFDLTKVRVPVVVFYSEWDDFIVPMVVARLVASLGSNVKEVISVPAFNHADFIIGVDADEHIYNRIIKIMNSSRYYPF